MAMRFIASLAIATSLLTAACGNSSDGQAGSSSPSGGYDGGPATPPPASCDVPAEGAAESIASPTTVVGSGTPASCTAAALDAAVQKAGVITFDCGPDPVTIAVTQQIRINNQGGADKLGDTLIDGGGKVTLDGGGTSRILYLNACEPPYNSSMCDKFEHPHLTIQNLKFKGGNVDDPQNGGGAVFANGGKLKVFKCDFTDNHCAMQGNEVKGGAIDTFLQTKPVYIVESTFAGNTCQSGGAIGSIGTSHTIINSAFTKNQGGAGVGGAIANDGNTYSLTICGSTITDNTARDFGGAVFQVSNDGSGTTTIDDSSVTGNASTDKKHTGGLYIQGTKAMVRNTTIAGNTADFAAGMFVFPNAPGNSIDFVNVTVSGNKKGAGVEIDDAIVGTLLSSTIVGNGTGIGSGSKVKIQDSIIASNDSGNCGKMHPSGGGNVEFPAGNGCTSDAIAGDPKLGMLQDNGGPAHTFTMLPAAGSPAIGAGKACPPTDELGNKRATEGCTSGAIEAK